MYIYIYISLFEIKTEKRLRHIELYVFQQSSDVILFYTT